MSDLSFEWDRSKANANLKKHRVSFLEARTAFDDPHTVLEYDAVHSEHEDRWILSGLSEKGRLLTIAYAKADEKIYRIISARRATSAEKARYALKG